MNKNDQNQGFIEVILLGVVVIGIAAIAGLWWYQGRMLEEEDGSLSPTVVPTLAVGAIETPTPSVETPTPTSTDVDVSDMDQIVNDVSSDDFGDSNLSDTNLGL